MSLQNTSEERALTVKCKDREGCESIFRLVKGMYDLESNVKEGTWYLEYYATENCMLMHFGDEISWRRDPRASIENWEYLVYARLSTADMKIMFDMPDKGHCLCWHQDRDSWERAARDVGVSKLDDKELRCRFWVIHADKYNNRKEKEKYAKEVSISTAYL